MAINDTVITVRGWVGADPIFYQNNQFDTQNKSHGATANVSAVLNVGVTPRNYVRKTGQYEDGETTWYSVRTFGKLAENVAACVHRGAPVLVRGKLSSRSFQAKDGSMKNTQVIVADSVGIELSNVVATYLRNSASNSGSGSSGKTNPTLQTDLSAAVPVALTQAQQQIGKENIQNLSASESDTDRELDQKIHDSWAINLSESEASQVGQSAPALC